MSIKYTSEEYKSGNTLRKRQVGEYKSENINWKLQEDINRTSTSWKTLFGKIQIGKYKSESTPEKCTSRNGNREIQIGLIQTRKYRSD